MNKEKSKMKLWKKLVLGVFVVLLAVGAYLVYLFQFKEYDTADTEVTEITRETYKIDLPDGSTIELDEEGNIIENNEDEDSSAETSGSTETSTSTEPSSEATSTDGQSATSENEESTESTSSNSSNAPSSSNGSTNTDSSTNGSKSGSGSKNESPSENTDSNTATVASINEKYEPVMENLQSQANGRIDSLIGRALTEYQTKKANGESVNYAYFYSKYSSAAAELEGRTDKVFYQIVSVIEKELKANGLAASHAQSFVTQYENEKEARRKDLINKAMNR